MVKVGPPPRRSISGTGGEPFRAPKIIKATPLTKVPRPEERSLPRNQVSTPTGPSPMFRGTNRAVSAVLLGATGMTACVAPHAMAEAPTLTRREEAHKHVEAADVRAEAGALDTSKYTLSDSELDDARTSLWSAYVSAGIGHTYDAAPAHTLGTPAADDAKTRGEVVMDNLIKRLESRMRITAYDMAHYESITPIEGAPGYKEIPASDVRRLVTDALKDIPIGELPGGKSLAQIVRSLPNASHLDAENMSYNEIEDALGDAQEAWFKEKFGPFLEEHKVEAVVVGATAVTALRASSSDIAKFMDDVTPGIEIWDDSGHIGSTRWTGEAELKYRNAHILPDLDLKGTARHNLGDLRLRADARGTLSLEGDEHVTGRVGVGARIGGDTWADLHGSINHEGDTRLRGTLGHIDRDAGFRIIGRGTADFSDHAAVGEADGRVRFELNATKDIEFRNATGDFGLYGSYGVDTDGGHEDGRIGVMFRLKW